MKQINLPVPDDLFDRAKDNIPHGVRAKLLLMVLTRILDAEEHYGALVYGAILSGDFDIRMKGMTRHEQASRAKKGSNRDGSRGASGENPGGSGGSEDK